MVKQSESTTSFVNVRGIEFKLLVEFFFGDSITYDWNTRSVLYEGKRATLNNLFWYFQEVLLVCFNNRDSFGSMMEAIAKKNSPKPKSYVMWEEEWEEQIKDFLIKTENNYCTVSEVLQKLGFKNAKDRTKSLEIKIAAILSHLGCTKKDMWLQGKSKKVWMIDKSQISSPSSPMSINTDGEENNELRSIRSKVFKTLDVSYVEGIEMSLNAHVARIRAHYSLSTYPNMGIKGVVGGAIATKPQLKPVNDDDEEIFAF